MLGHLLSSESGSPERDWLEWIDGSARLADLGREIDQEQTGTARFLLPLTPTRLACYVVAVDQAKAVAESGADAVVAHLGLTPRRSIGGTAAKTLEDCSDYINAGSEAALEKRRRDVMNLCHGGLTSMLDHAQYVLRNAQGVNGYHGASSGARLSTKIAATAQMEELKAIRFQVPKP